jgi:hypothetical protein
MRSVGFGKAEPSPGLVPRGFRPGSAMSDLPLPVTGGVRKLLGVALGDASGRDESRTVPFAAMTLGLRLAVERFQEAGRASNPLAAVTPLFEALNWAVALDERLKKEWIPDGKDHAPGWDWPMRLRGETEADIVRGVRFIRNRVHHQWADAVTVVEARHYYPPRESEWVWVPAGDLPKAERADDRGRDGYERMMEGHPVDSILTTLTLIYDFVTQLLEPLGPPKRWIAEDV